MNCSSMELEFIALSDVVNWSLSYLLLSPVRISASKV